MYLSPRLNALSVLRCGSVWNLIFEMRVGAVAFIHVLWMAEVAWTEPYARVDAHLEAQFDNKQRSRQTGTTHRIHYLRHYTHRDATRTRTERERTHRVDVMKTGSAYAWGRGTQLRLGVKARRLLFFLRPPASTLKHILHALTD